MTLRARLHARRLRRLFDLHSKPWTPAGYRLMAFYLARINGA